MNQEHEQKAQEILKDLTNRSETEIGYGKFEGMELEKLVIPEGIESIGYDVFKGAKIKELVLPSTLKTAYPAFHNAVIEKLVVPEGAQLGELLGVQENNSGQITEIVLPQTCVLKSNNSLYTSIPIKKVVLKEGSHFVFDECLKYNTDVEEVVLPEGIVQIGKEAFRSCKNLKKINIPKSVTLISSEAFSFTAIESIEIPENLKGINNYVFYHCSNLRNIVLPDTIQWVGESAFCGCKQLKKINLPNISWIGRDSFSGSALESITLPEGVDAIPSGSFLGCKNLKEVKLPSTLQLIGNIAFEHCSNLTQCDIPSSVKSIGEKAFSNTGIKKAIIPEGVKELPNNLFDRCLDLEEVTIPSTVTKIGDEVFQGSRSLKQIVIPDSVTQIGATCFQGCSSLKEVTLSKNLKSISEYCFVCTGLEQIVVPEGVTTISEMAFQGSDKLKKAVLPESLTEIGSYAFAYTDIDNITIPKNVVNIPEWLFMDCKNLNTVEVLGACENVDSTLFASVTRSNIPSARLKININPEKFKIVRSESGLRDEMQGFNKLYLSKDGTQIQFCKEIDKVLEKTHFSIDAKPKQIFNILTANYRQNFVKLSNLKESKKIKFMPKDYVLEVFPASEIENYFINNNHVMFSKLVSAMGIDNLSDELALRDFLKIYYAIGGFSPVESERAKAFNYFEKFLIDNEISVKQGKKLLPSGKVDVTKLAMGIHERFDGINLTGPYNPTFAKFFMKYFHENPNFMKFDLPDENGFVGDGEIDYLCQAHNRFKYILEDNPNMLINTTSRALKLTPEFVAKASRIMQYDNIMDGNMELAKLVGKYGYSQEQFNQMQEIFEQAKNKKEDYVIVADKASEESCVRYRFLEKDDPLGFVIGNITNCCQQLGGAGETCTIDGFVNPNSGFLVFEEKLFDEQGNPTGEYRILGQAYIWYNKEMKTVCLDNIEVPRSVHRKLEKADNAPDKMSYSTLMKAVQESAEAVMSAMNKDKVMVEKVTVGTGFNNLNKQLREIYGLPKPENIAQAPKGVYTDANSQYTILTYDQYTKNQANKIKNSLQQSQEILNTLANESTLQNGREN